MLIVFGILGLIFEVYWLFSGGLQYLGFTGLLLGAMGMLVNFMLIGAGLRGLSSGNQPHPPQPEDHRAKTWDEIRSRAAGATDDAADAPSGTDNLPAGPTE